MWLLSLEMMRSSCEPWRTNRTKSKGHLMAMVVVVNLQSMRVIHMTLMKTVRVQYHQEGWAPELRHPQLLGVN